MDGTSFSVEGATFSDSSLSEKGVTDILFATWEIDTLFSLADTNASLSSAVVVMSFFSAEASTAREGDKMGPRGILLVPERGDFLFSFIAVKEGSGSTFDLSFVALSFSACSMTSLV